MQPARARARAGPRARPGPRSGGGRSRHICGPPPRAPFSSSRRCTPGKPASAAAAALDVEARRAPIAASAARALARLWRPGTARSSSAGPGAPASKRDDLVGRASQRIGRRRPGSDQAARRRRRSRAKASCSSASEPQREWWSISTLVTTATSGRSSRKLASLSSASATTHSPSPQPALAARRRRARARAPRRRRRRPGRRRSPAAPRRPSPSSSSCRGCRRPRSAASRRRARRAARRGGSARRRARGPRASSGLSSAIAVETTTSAPSGRLAASWPTAGSSPAARSRSI